MPSLLIAVPAYHGHTEASLARVNDTIVIRPIQPRDAEAVASLSTSLGYPATAAEMQSRIEDLARSSERIVFVAILQEVVVGWADAAVERHLQSPPVVVLGGLVVSEDMRGRRIGQQLCHAVEHWALKLNITTVRVRSQIKRADAHRFYLRDGYTQVKTSAIFEKSLL